MYNRKKSPKNYNKHLIIMLNILNLLIEFFKHSVMKNNFLLLGGSLITLYRVGKGMIVITQNVKTGALIKVNYEE